MRVVSSTKHIKDDVSPPRPPPVAMQGHGMAHFMLLPALALVVVASAWLTPAALGDPQATQLNLGCSTYNATPASAFLLALNSTFADLRANLSAGGGFATAAEPRAAAPAFAMAQCRPYVVGRDCVACFDTAAARLRGSCGAANGARVIFDGCVIRYESAAFFDQATLPGNTQLCNGSAVGVGGFADAARALVADLAAAVPRVPGFAAAAARGGVYAAAQCVETVGEGGCAQCLKVAVGNIDGCPPNSDGRAVDAGCFMRYSHKPFFPANATVDLAAYLRSGKKSSRKGAIIAGIMGGVAFLIFIGLLTFLLIRWSRNLRPRRGDILGATELQGPTSFYYHDLKAATNNFNEKSKLGEGGFGDVYKGLLKNGKTVAVKRLIVMDTSRAKADFESEVKLISNVHHRNLVRLLGCSRKASEFLLVYEYMANGSLDKFLFGERRGTLNWKQRFNIIVGMARGLAYLHQEFHVCIIHRDIKSSNVLLDDDFQPKIADFGLARLLPDDHSHLSTKFAGTLGYTAPEYAIHGQLSEKVDTYSFGVVVLEILSGRKSNDTKLDPETQYLLEWVWKLYESDNLLALVDESLDPEEYKPDEVKRIMEIALLCTQSAVAARPMMSEVVVLLLTRNDPELQPTRPTFIDATSRVRGETSTSSSSSASKATVSVSQVSGRGFAKVRESES
ncbi:cold-responsive protein kinase 1-like isoform X4 [Panicum hallii]|uniref:cold-responsive protein kinase 1-like isoform X4 n=1 Tax=Panicum hallii TaxID=206008 RepID=UPI000DF4EFF1|nr:cold-responsive protein kinase 1-like isoform X4 [Panicum hallii]